MRATRRCLGLAAAGLALAGLSVLFERPLLLLGTAGIGAVLLVAQFAFVRRLRRLDAALAVDLSIPQRYVVEGATTPVTLRARAPETPLSVAVEAPLPASVDGPAAARRRLELGDETATTFSVSWPVVGTVAFAEPEVTVSDAHGLFAETMPRGPAPRVVVEPRRPRRLHVGQGGDQLGATFGEHAAGELGEGINPAELRRYVPGDAASDIDWKATARLNEPYVREHEIETDQRTVLVVDHRRHLDDGPAGGTQFDYLREVAVAIAEQARELDDPLGLYAVGDEGTTVERDPGTDPRTYRSVHDSLHELAPTAATEGDRADATRRGPGDARRVEARLAEDESAFGTTLRPYLQDAEAYVREIEGDPLFRTVRTLQQQTRGTLWTYLFTDDSRRAELRETVKLARRGGDRVVVFVAPDALFEPGGLADLDAAYERYAEFEEFRRTLAAMDRVSAFEVGPGDRIDAVLDAGRGRGERRNQNT